ncbi:hypothetical protein ASPCAL12632 [Aspergillus calidoustus]|uniref:Multicopper oxidase n=1 Tax=Aspergillus calidoustus TaxID=454130 RepID=A0A0U5CGA8_ASPCI|nr:hypothetical protein ASPCAL12632 [Aspergillus calidoustus]
MIRPAPSRRRPFEDMAAGTVEREQLLQAERDAVSILLNDWTHDLSDTIFSRYFETGAFPSCVDSILANGLGRVECLPRYMLDAGPGLGLTDEVNATHHDHSATMTTSVMQMPSMARRMEDSAENNPHDQMSMSPMSTTNPSESTMSTTGGMTMPSSDTMGESMSLGPRGCMPPMMFRPGYDINSLPAETCVNTTSEQLVINANASQGWLALNLVNSGAVSNLKVSLDSHSMHVYAADGLYVTPQEVKVLEIALGQRYSVMIELDQSPGNYYLRFATYPNGDMQQVLEGQAIVSYSTTGNDTISVDPMSVWMLTNGSATQDANELVESRLAPFEGNRPPTTAADVTRFFNINQTDIVTWVVDQYPYAEPTIPIIYGNMSDGWNANTTLHSPTNSTVDIVMNVANGSLDTMGHPMHLHGHKFWVLGSGSGSFPYQSVAEAPPSLINLDNPPYRDTANLPPSGWLAIRYITDNPGAWILHCHIQWHIVSGMAVVLVEGEDQLDALIRQGNSPDPTTPLKSGTAPSYIVNFFGSLIVLGTMLNALVAFP